MGIRDYLYISDTQIDNWLPQVPPATARKITVELGFNIGLLSGKLETQREAKTAPADRVSKCQILEKYFRANEKVGSPESGSKWISGTVQARVFPITAKSAVLFISSSVVENSYSNGFTATSNRCNRHRAFAIFSVVRIRCAGNAWRNGRKECYVPDSGGHRVGRRDSAFPRIGANVGSNATHV